LLLQFTNVKIQGKSGFDYKIDFVIPTSRKKNRPERFVFAINTPRENVIKSTLFTWNDIRLTRADKENDLIIFLNDRKNFDEKVIDALNIYNAKTIKWSKRQDYMDELAV